MTNWTLNVQYYNLFVDDTNNVFLLERTWGNIIIVMIIKIKIIMIRIIIMIMIMIIIIIIIIMVY